MSYSDLYKIQYYDFFNVKTEIYIKKLDYGGASTDISCGEDPMRITLNNEGSEKFQTVRGTSVEVDLLSETDFQFISLHTSDFKQYQIQIDKGGTIYWKGWLLPDYYQEPYTETPYVVTIHASDGLGLLKNYDLVNSNGSHLTGKLAIGDILNQIFLKIGTELNLYENINIYEDNINSTAADSVMYQIYIDCAIFYDIEGNPISCYDALVEILKPLNAYITQSEGAWHIIRVPTNKSSYTRRLWTWNNVVGFTYDSNAAYDPQLSTTSAGIALASLVRFVGNTLTVSPPWNEFTIRQDYGTKESIIDNGEFNYDGFMWNGVRWWVSHWVDINTPDYEPSSKSKNPEVFFGHTLTSGHPNFIKFFARYVSEDEYCLQINGTNAVIANATGVVNSEIDLVASITDSLLFHFEFSTNSVTAEIYLEISIIGATTQYMSSDGTWGAAQAYITIIDNLEDQWITKEIRSDYIPIDGVLTIKLFQTVASGATHFVKWENIKVGYLPNNANPDKNLELITPVNSNNIYIPSEIDLILGDMPNHTNNAILYQNGLFYGVGSPKTPTSAWTDGNTGISKTLVNSMADAIKIENNKPYQIISGTIYSKLIDWLTIIREINNSNYLFMINGGTLYDKAGAWDLELIQFAETFDILAEDGSTLVSEISDQLITE